MKLPTPGAPFSRIKAFGDITIDLSSENVNTLALQTGHPDLLPPYNEYTLKTGHTLPSAGTYSFTNDYDANVGILNIQRNWIAVYNSAGSIVDFFLSTYRPEKLQFMVNSSGYISQLILNSRNGIIYHGQLIYSNLTRDTNADGIPDVLDPNVIGSLPYFLKPYTSIDGTVGAEVLLLSGGQEIVTSNGKTLFVRGH
ncbi:MAG: hypothetical protein PHW84_02005 [Methanosarcina sp.]|nr:hypothetical protein [Methanosarcina sp.]